LKLLRMVIAKFISEDDSKNLAQKKQNFLKFGDLIY
jgi:hypothetical protein